jgi:4-amino-4-deoxy-L-arabinose transferase-like glycosyltransferase
MSESWHDFIFGAFDPAGTVTVDKLPGALWLQALSLRVFGFHIWALVLPQVVEGVLTILVLYRAVRRLAGPAAGLTAAAVLAVTPITVLLSRGNVSDSLLILLLVLAADATSAALLTGSLRQLLLAGVWVGLAFQAKMIQAWLVLPALAAAYLLAAPAARLRTRCAHVALAGLVTVVVSLCWMTAVSLVPSQDRPYVDGSRNDSVYTQVFDYNGLGRLTGNWVTVAGAPPSPLLVAARERGQLLTAETMGIKPGWHRLLAGPFAADGGWLLPAAFVGAAGVLISRRREGRRDPLRAAVVLWGGWWLVLAVFFSAGTYLNSYYVAALVPAVAALCGTGIAACGPGPWPARVRLIVAATVLGCAGYGAYLISGTASGPVVLTAVALIAAVAAAAQLLLPASGKGGHRIAVAFAGAAVLLLPAAASVSGVIGGLGPFDTPFESSKTAHDNQVLAADAPALTRAVHRLELETPPADALFGSDTSGLAQSYIVYSGREVLPIGGFLGNVPAPTLAALRADISHGYVRVFVLPVSPPGPDPRVRWIESHCTGLPPPPNRRPVPYATFLCGPGTAQPSPRSPR